MMRKRVCSGILISALTVIFAATPVIATEADIETYTEESAVVGKSDSDSDVEEQGDNSFVVNSSEGDVAEEELSDENLSDDIGEAEDPSVEENISTDDLEEESPEEEPVSEIDEDSDLEYGIVTLAAMNGFGQGPDGEWYYYTNWKIDTSLNSVVYGTVDGKTDWWYVVGGKVQLDFTGLADYKNDSGWWYITNGRVNRNVNTVAKNKNGWWYVKNGKVDKTYTGFATNENGSWYMENGKLLRDQNTVVKDTKGAIGAAGEWYYVVGSKVQSDFTGLADYSNASGWWYVTNGRVDRTVTTVAKNKNGWYYVKNGKVDKSYTGFATNENGSWYMENGKLLRDQNTVIKDTKGAIGEAGEWYYVVGSKVQSDFTGLANYSNANGWWYITEGMVDRSVNTVAENKNGWWYVLAGKVRKDFTGLADYSNADGWFYITNGKVDTSVNTVAKNKNGWWYVKDGKVDKTYTGFATNENGAWYMENGKLTRTANSVIKDTNGVLGVTSEWYYVVGSKVQYDFTGLADYSNSSGWWYITNGVVDRSFTGVAENKNGLWYIVDGKVQKSFTGTVTVDGTDYSVTGGKAVLSIGDGDNGIPEDYEFNLSPEDIIYACKDTTQLDAPIFSGTVNSSGTMTLTWDPVPGAEKYRVFRKKYGDSSWTKITDTTATSYTDNLWTESTLYYYTVRCVSADGSEYMSDYIKGFSGSAVAGYAKQFVGNPYVYGGISLTNGCDCSGFVMQVYAHFGVFMPHYSGTQITLGKEVSYANAQPGDIMGRTGHTMLYIGNGQIVNAQDSNHGIVINDVSSISYTNIRRIF